MARTDVTVGSIVRTGLATQTPVAGIVDGHQFINTGRVYVRVVKVTSTGNITFQTPIQVGGFAVADQVVLVTPGTDLLIGPFPTNVFNQSDGKVYIDYESAEETEFTIEVYSI